LIGREPPFLALKREGSESGKARRARRSALIGEDAISRYKGKDKNNFPLLPADVMRDAWESATTLLDADSEMRLSIAQTRIIAERELSSSPGEVKGRRFDGDAAAGIFR